MKGETGNPAIPAVKQHMILKRGPSLQEKPRFIRDNISNHVGIFPLKDWYILDDLILLS